MNSIDENEGDIITELTVVKEIRKQNIIMNNNERVTPIPSQSVETNTKKISQLKREEGNNSEEEEEEKGEQEDNSAFYLENKMKHNEPSNDNNNKEIMKIDEDTLYIVQNKYSIRKDQTDESNKNKNILESDTNSITTTTTTSQPNEIDKEVRKNFELKTKKGKIIGNTQSQPPHLPPQSKKSQIVNKNNKNNTDNSNSSSINVSSKYSKGIHLRTGGKNAIKANSKSKLKSNCDKITKSNLNEDSIYEDMRSSLVQMLFDLKRWMMTFHHHNHHSNHHQMEEKGDQIMSPNDINDYQLHFFKIDFSNILDKEVKEHYYKETNYIDQNDLFCQQFPVLVLLYDADNKENFKFNLELNYNRSIIDTHFGQVDTFLNIDRSKINIIAKINVFYVSERSATTSTPTTTTNKKSNKNAFHKSDKANKKRFFDFSLIQTNLNITNNINTNHHHHHHHHHQHHRHDHNNSHYNSYNLPVGKYFVNIKYKHVTMIPTEERQTNCFDRKESIVDLSLLPVAIRAQIIAQCEHNLNNSTATIDSNKPKDVLDLLPVINLLAIDSHLIQCEINKQRDQLIQTNLLKQRQFHKQQEQQDSDEDEDEDEDDSSDNDDEDSNDDSDDDNQEIEIKKKKQKGSGESDDLENFLKNLTLDLNSYYICERVHSVNTLSSIIQIFL
jgi:hypothetical protein